MLPYLCTFGSVELIDWWLSVVNLNSMTIPVYDDCFFKAARTGSRTIIEYLKHKFPNESESFVLDCDWLVLERACLKGHTNILDWAYATFPTSKDWKRDNLRLLSKLAIGMEQYEVLLWIQNTFSSKSVWTYKSIIIAAEVKNLAILDWVSSMVPELNKKQYSACLKATKKPISVMDQNSATVETTIILPEIERWLLDTYQQYCNICTRDLVWYRVISNL